MILHCHEFPLAGVVLCLTLSGSLWGAETEKIASLPESGRTLIGRLVETETHEPLAPYEYESIAKPEYVYVTWILEAQDEIQMGPSMPLAADRRFRISGAPADARKLQIRTDYSLSALVPLPAGGGEISLGDVGISRGANLAGRFIRAENKAPLAMNDLAARFGPGTLMVSIPEAATAYEKGGANHFVSLEDGSAQRTGCFAVITVPPKIERLAFTMAGRALAEFERPQYLPGKRNRLGDVEVALGYKVVGRLVDEAATATVAIDTESGMKRVIGAEVVATLANGDRLRLNYVFNTKGPGGRFEFWDAPKETRSLTFYPRNYLPRTCGPISLNAAQGADLGEIRLRRGERVSGTITEADGTPIKDYTVLVAGAPGDVPAMPPQEELKNDPDSLSARMPPAANAHWAVLNKQGEFIVQGLYTGKARLLGRFPRKQSAGADGAALPRLLDQELMIKSGTDNQVEIILPR